MADTEIPQLLLALKGDLAQRQPAYTRLVEMGADAVEPLIELVQAEVGREARSAADILGDIGDERAFPVLVVALRSDNLLLAGSAVSALEKFTRHDILPCLLDALPHVRIMTQQAILLAIQRLGDVRAVAPLVKLLSEADTPLLRTAVIKILGELGDPSAAPMIRSFADDPDHHVRDWVRIVLAKFDA